MTRNIHADLIHAYAEGAEIQLFFAGKWWDETFPYFFPDTKYRIKPEPHLLRIDSRGYEILRIDKEGMVYMGQRVKDAGEAYEAWIKTLKLINNRAEE